MYNLSREQVKILSTLIHKELLEYKHVPNKEGGSFYNLLTSTLKELETSQQTTGSTSGRSSTV